jgi:hypothetical protein
MEYIINVCITMPVSRDPQPQERLFVQDVLAVFDFLVAIDNNIKPYELMELFFEALKLPLSNLGKVKLIKIFENYIGQIKTLQNDAVYLDSIQLRFETLAQDPQGIPFLF